MTAWVGAGAAVVIAAFFSLAELALVSVSRLRLRHWVRESMAEGGGWIDGDAVDHPYRLLSPVLVGHALAVTAAAMLVAEALHPARPAGVREAFAAAGLATAVLAPVLHVLGETLPAAVARARGHQLFPVVSVVLRACGWAFRPLVALADGTAALALAAVGGAAGGAGGRRNLEALLVESERVGVVEPAEREIIAGVFEFGRTPARAVMTPMERVAAAPAGATAGEITALIGETGYSRIPLYRDAPDRIVGMVHVFDLFKLPSDAVPEPRRVVRSRPDMPCDDLLLVMKRRRCHLAVVVERGSAVGILTMEDLVEELVGEIRDEHDVRAEALAPVPGAFVVDGHTPIAEIEERRSIALPVAGAETVAGFVIGRLGRIPRTGETFLYRGWTIDILDATPQRVRRVRFRPPPDGRAPSAERS